MATETPPIIALSGGQLELIATACRQSFPHIPQLNGPGPSRQETQAAITRLYARIGLPAPTFFWVENPEQLVEAPFLLQSLASVPHGTKRRLLRRSKVHLAPSDLGWQLGNRLQGQWLESYVALCEQLTPEILGRLYEYAHYESAMVAAYDQPDVLSTCGSRLGFSVVPALKNFMLEILLHAHSHIATVGSIHMSLEIQRIYEADNSRREWNNRAAIGVILSEDRNPQPLFFDLISAPAIGAVPNSLLFKLKDQSGELADYLADLQDTSCHHPRVDGTSALQTTYAYGQSGSQDLDQLLVAAGRKSIYRLVWGSWSRDQFSTLKAVESIWGDKLFEGRLGETVNDFLTMRAGAFAYSLNSRCVFACALPVVAHVDTSNQLNNFDGPALEFPDGYGLHMWRGLGVDAQLVKDTAHLDVARIERELNVETRRLLIERYGTVEYLTDSGASVIQKDNYGELLCKRLRGDEPIVMVRVANSTPEPDGTFKHYYLRVPPTITTAREAVAWTFGISAAEYQPERET